MFQHQVTTSFRILLGCVFLFSLAFTAITSQPVQAKTKSVQATPVSAKYYVGNGTGSFDYHSQGATITRDYYIFTDWLKPNGPATIVKCKRIKSSSCTRSGTRNYEHANTMQYNWGRDYFWVYNWSSGYKKHCLKISNLKETKSNVSSKCGPSYNASGMNRVYRQGFVRYNDYYLVGDGTEHTNYIVLYNKNKKKIMEVSLPSEINEIEDVMVDGDTGIIYFTSLQYEDYNSGSKYVRFYKIPRTSSLNKYIKPLKDYKTSKTSSPITYTSRTRSSNQNKTPSTLRTTYDGTIRTAFFGTIKDDGKGCGVFMIIGSVLEILTYGVGILGVLGLVLVGTKYLTAGGNEEQTQKAKRRLLEIVIGLVAYVILWAIVNWLMPGGNFNTSTTCATTTSRQINQSEQG